MQTLFEDDCFAIRQAARYVSRIYDRHLSKANITATQFSILSRLAEFGHLTTQKIAYGMVMDRTTIVRAIKPLQRDGLIYSNLQSDRSLTVGITVAGLKRLESARAHCRSAQDEFEQIFGAHRAEALRRELFAVVFESNATCLQVKLSDG